MKSNFIFETAQELDNEGSADKEWTSTAVAAKSLGVSPRTIRSYIKKGLLEGKTEDNETTRRWYVSLDSLNALRTRYVGDSSTSSAENGAGGGDIAQTIQNVSIRLSEEAARAGELRVRLELAEQTEHTLRGALESERERAEQNWRDAQYAYQNAESAREISQRLLRERQKVEEQTQQLLKELEDLEALLRKAEERSLQLEKELQAERSKGFFRRLFGRRRL
jgi:DNA-binding transcriptional MerR regulator